MFEKTFTVIAVTALAFALIAQFAQATTNEAAQTDWSGGPGKPGPVTDWGDRFDSEDYVSWSGNGEYLPHDEDLHIRWKNHSGDAAVAEWNWTFWYPGKQYLKDLWFDPFMMLEKEVTW